MGSSGLAKDRFDGIEAPLGNYNDHGQWYPTVWEWCECCEIIKRPTKNRPLTLLKHCRTLKHVKNLVAKHNLKQTHIKGM